MATIGATYPNLLDAMKGSAEGAVVEILNRQNPILDDAIATECNMDTVHRHSIRTGLPSVAWGRLYQGIPQSKSTMQQVDDTTGFMETASTIDKRLLDLSSDAAQQRLIDSAPYFESMNQEMATGIFYHDTATSPEKFKGLGARYSTVVNSGSTSIPGIGSNVIDGGGTGSNNTSIWFVTWGDHATTLLYPKGTKAGISHEDKGEQRVLDALGNPYYAKEAIYRWHVGVAVKDWRYNARICNIDYTAAFTNGTVDLWSLLRRAYYRLQSRRRDAIGSRIAIYMNRDVLQILDAQSTDRALISGNPNYTALRPANVEGQEVLTYRGIPIRETDALLWSESRVV